MSQLPTVLQGMNGTVNQKDEFNQPKKINSVNKSNMKTKLLVIVVFTIFSISSNAQQTLPPIAKQRPADFEYLAAPDSTGHRALIKQASKIQTQQLKLPYPIIFIHGLNSNSGTWDNTTNFMDSQYGFTFGGFIDYCINYDGDNTTTNLNFYPTVGADLALYTNTANLIDGDYYYVNFDVGSDGSYHPNGSIYDVISNQEAIAKQGLAIKWAIFYVLQKTGRDKVILMGHSMGGLAAREYLQNTSIWQPDGQHHVAKLITTGTPHGGSNQVTGGSWIADCQSAAYRDLRTTYSGSGDPCVYLFGGLESNTVMNLAFCSNFYSIDVNCNGTSGQNITGLNQKNLYTNLDYSCIVGMCTGCIGTQTPGDGIVLEVSADLTNYYASMNASLFYYTAFAVTQIHTDLPDQSYQNLQGLDEPNEYNISYNINFDTVYTAFNTVQDINSPYYPTDYDDFKFSVPSNMSIGISINNIILSDLAARILNSSYQIVGTTHHSSGASSLNFSQSLTAGTYYLETYGTPTTTSYLSPYTFVLNNTTGIGENTSQNYFHSYNYPNPFKNTCTISFALPKSDFVTIKVYDLFGQHISTLVNERMNQGKHEIIFDGSQLTSGIYFYTIQSEIKIETHKLNLEK